MPIDRNYLETLRERKKKGHIFRAFQMSGLEIAGILHDEAHKSLYIRLAKTHNPDMLIKLARDVAERKNIQNYGAYFMRLLALKKAEKKKITKKKS